MATAGTRRRTGKGRRSGDAPSKTTATQPPTDVAVDVPPPTRQQIRERAYQIYLARGNQGDPVSDWLRAERELIAEARAIQGVRG